VGALNSLIGVEHRRDALWQVEWAGKPEGPFLMQQSQWLREKTNESTLAFMTAEERLIVDYAVSSVTTVGLLICESGATSYIAKAT
jgi:error-prone DNA polymerase